MTPPSISLPTYIILGHVHMAILIMIPRLSMFIHYVLITTSIVPTAFTSH